MLPPSPKGYIFLILEQCFVWKRPGWVCQGGSTSNREHSRSDSFEWVCPCSKLHQKEKEYFKFWRPNFISMSPKRLLNEAALWKRWNRSFPPCFLCLHRTDLHLILFNLECYGQLHSPFWWQEFSLYRYCKHLNKQIENLTIFMAFKIWYLNLVNSQLIIDNNYVIQSLPDFVREEREMSLSEKKPKAIWTVFVKAGLTPGAQKNGAHQPSKGTLWKKKKVLQSSSEFSMFW